ncbi:hypothetical protein EV182_004412, partial [Spiromyces aspiralis]
AIFVPTFSEGPEGLVHIRIDQIRPKVIVTDMGIYPRIKKALELISAKIQDNTYSPTVIFVDEVPKDAAVADHECARLDDVLSTSPFKRLTIDTIEQQKGTIAIVNHSSGSTGLPKAIATSHYAFVQRIHSRLHLIPVQKDTDTNLVTDGVAMTGFPMTYTYCLISTVMEHLARGIITIMATELEVQNYMESLEKFGANQIRCSPSFLDMMVNFKDQLAKYDLSSLRTATCAGSTIEQAVKANVERQLGIKVINEYGSSEMIYVCYDTGNDIPYSVGRIAPGNQFKVVDQDGKEVGLNVVGQIMVKSPGRFMYYYNNLEMTIQAFENNDLDGFYKMGDVGEITEDGIVKIYDRDKYTIHYKNKHYVAPSVIESRLWQHPLVEDAIVMPYFSHELGTEVAQAFIVLANNGNNELNGRRSHDSNLPLRRARSTSSQSPPATQGGDDGNISNGSKASDIEENEGSSNGTATTVSDAAEAEMLDEIVTWTNQQARFEGEKILGPVKAIPRPYFPRFSKGRRYEIFVMYVNPSKDDEINMD